MAIRFRKLALCLAVVFCGCDFDSPIKSEAIPEKLPSKQSEDMAANPAAEQDAMLVGECRRGIRSFARFGELGGRDIAECHLLATYRMTDATGRGQEVALGVARFLDGEREHFALIQVMSPSYAKLWGTLMNRNGDFCIYFSETKPTKENIFDKMRFPVDGDSWEIHNERMFPENWARLIDGEPPTSVTDMTIAR